MLVNKAILQLMKDEKCSWGKMANHLGLSRPTGVGSRLHFANMRTDNVIEMLSFIGYELVIQKSTKGTRDENQIVLEKSTQADRRQLPTKETLSINETNPVDEQEDYSNLKPLKIKSKKEKPSIQDNILDFLKDE